MEHVKIIIENCNNCSLDVSAKIGLKLYKEFSIKHPNVFYFRFKVNIFYGIVHFINKVS